MWCGILLFCWSKHRTICSPSIRWLLLITDSVMTSFFLDWEMYIVLDYECSVKLYLENFTCYLLSTNKRLESVCCQVQMLNETAVWKITDKETIGFQNVLDTSWSDSELTPNLFVTCTASQMMFAFCCTFKEWMFCYLLCFTLPLSLSKFLDILFYFNKELQCTRRVNVTNFLQGIIRFCIIEWIIRINNLLKHV